MSSFQKLLAAAKASAALTRDPMLARAICEVEAENYTRPAPRTRFLGEEVLTGKYGLGRVTEIGPPDRTKQTNEPEWIGVTPHIAGYQMKFAPDNVLDTPLPADANVTNKARAIIMQSPPDSPPNFSYIDVGEALVSYLRGERTVAHTMSVLDDLAKDYATARRKHPR